MVVIHENLPIWELLDVELFWVIIWKRVVRERRQVFAFLPGFWILRNRWTGRTIHGVQHFPERKVSSA